MDQPALVEELEPVKRLVDHSQGIRLRQQRAVEHLWQRLANQRASHEKRMVVLRVESSLKNPHHPRLLDPQIFPRLPLECHHILRPPLAIAPGQIPAHRHRRPSFFLLARENHALRRLRDKFMDVVSR
jgi:hypothetical protein